MTSNTFEDSALLSLSAKQMPKTSELNVQNLCCSHAIKEGGSSRYTTKQRDLIFSFRLLTDAFQ